MGRNPTDKSIQKNDELSKGRANSDNNKREHNPNGAKQNNPDQTGSEDDGNHHSDEVMARINKGSGDDNKTGSQHQDADDSDLSRNRSSEKREGKSK